jgi:primosomal protein N' (replication factor Y)
VVPLPLPERFVLTAEQRGAIAAIEGALARGGYATFLLHGVTASGKTEVYLRAAAAAREAGARPWCWCRRWRSAASWCATSAAASERGSACSTRTSRWGSGAATGSWRAAARSMWWSGALGRVRAAARLGLIVVDEEHEPAYKQSTQLRYHGRDVAVQARADARHPGGAGLGDAQSRVARQRGARQVPLSRAAAARGPARDAAASASWT